MAKHVSEWFDDLRAWRSVETSAAETVKFILAVSNPLYMDASCSSKNDRDNSLV
jgi:hypothetical protein